MALLAASRLHANQHHVTQLLCCGSTGMFTVRPCHFHVASIIHCRQCHSPIISLQRSSVSFLFKCRIFFQLHQLNRTTPIPAGNSSSEMTRLQRLPACRRSRKLSATVVAPSSVTLRDYNKMSRRTRPSTATSTFLSVDHPTTSGKVVRADHDRDGSTRSGRTMESPQRICGGVRRVVVTEEQRYGPRSLCDNDDDDDEFHTIITVPVLLIYPFFSSMADNFMCCHLA